MIAYTRGRGRIQGIITEPAIITILILALIGLLGKTAIAALAAMATATTTMTTIARAVLTNVHIPAKGHASELILTKPAETTTPIPAWNGPALKTARLGRYARTGTAFLLNALPAKPRRSHADTAEKEPGLARAITNGENGALARARENAAQEKLKPETAETMALKAEPAALPATGEAGAPALERTKPFTFQLQPALQADAFL